MTDESLTRASRLLDVFSDVDRLRLIGRLTERSWTVTGLAGELGMRPQAVARHLRNLEEAGLVCPDAENPAILAFDIEALREQTAALRPDEPDEFAGEAGDDARVLRSFVRDGTLVHLPSQRSRWTVVLRWLAGLFEPGRRYTEPEVNEILGTVHEDYASLRRQLVDEGFMSRDRGVYWLVDGNDDAERA